VIELIKFTTPSFTIEADDATELLTVYSFLLDREKEALSSLKEALKELRDSTQWGSTGDELNDDSSAFAEADITILDDDGWVVHDGKGVPAGVDNETQVEVQSMDGCLFEAAMAGVWRWEHDDPPDDSDIWRYRIIKPTEH
jgi:hypothetical protein